MMTERQQKTEWQQEQKQNETDSGNITQELPTPSNPQEVQSHPHALLQQQKEETQTLQTTPIANTDFSPTAQQQQQQLNEPLLSEAEAARFLGISKMTLLRKRNSGEIGFFRGGFRVLYSKEKHLLPFLEKCERDGRNAET